MKRKRNPLNDPINEAEWDIDEGRTFTIEQVRQHFKELFKNDLDRGPHGQYL